MTQTPAPRVAIYARQSVAAIPGAPLDDRHARQVERCRSLAELRGWEVAAVFQETASATRLRGEGTAWSALLAAIAAGSIDVVLAVDLDRLLRTTRDLLTLIESGARVATVDGEIDLSTADGEFRATMLASVARFEARRKAERQVRANRARQAQGMPLAGRAPFGYQWTPARDRVTDTEALAIDPDDADTVKAAYAAALSGTKVTAIGGELDGNPSADTVRRWLTNPAYAALIPPPSSGRYRAGTVRARDCTPGQWEPLVSVADWDAVQDILGTPPPQAGPGRAPRSLLSGLAVCAVCGSGVRSMTRSDTQHYRCPRGHVTRRAADLDAHAARLVSAMLTAPEPPAHPPADAARHDPERRRLDAVARRARDDYADGLISRAAADQLARRATQRLRELDQDTGDARGHLLDRARRSGDGWQSWPLGERRALVAALVTLIVLPVGHAGRGADIAAGVIDTPR